MSAVGLDFVILFVSEQDLDKIGPIANENVWDFCIVIVAD